MNKKRENWIDKLLMNKWFYIITTIVFLGGFTIVFKWQHFCYWFDDDYQVDNELFGTFGDFIGGVLGTLFTLISILILIRTFNQQRHVTEENKKQIETQRFNDLFFELLRLYQSQVTELGGQIEDKNGTLVYNNKDFFDVEKQLLHRAFKVTTSYRKNQISAINLYMLFYIKHKTKIGASFRTLYRIYDLIDKSDIDECNKKDYLKIIRAQLTDSELFFLRYNAMTYYGENFVSYLNRYHALKHLPTFDLLEFKDWWKDLNQVERMGINIVFHNSTRFLRHALLEENTQISFKSSKYNFTIQLTSNHDVNIQICIDLSQQNHTQEYRGFEKFDSQKLQALLDCYLKETFIYSNFKQYNKIEDIKFYSSPIITKNNKTIINSGVRNKKREQLKLKYIL